MLGTDHLFFLTIIQEPILSIDDKQLILVLSVYYSITQTFLNFTNYYSITQSFLNFTNNIDKIEAIQSRAAQFVADIQYHNKTSMLAYVLSMTDSNGPPSSTAESLLQCYAG